MDSRFKFLAASMLSLSVVAVPAAAAAQTQPASCAKAVAAGATELLTAAKLGEPANSLHQLATGKGVKVAVIDTGVSPHPRLKPVLAGTDFLTKAPYGSLLDCDGHGTVVAGIIAAKDQGDGLSGLAPDVQLISIKQTSAATAEQGTVAGLTAAINSALDQGAQVINISVVSCVPAATASRLDQTALTQALWRAEKAGTVIVAAAGNQSSSCQPGDLVLPAHLAPVVPVAALTEARTQIADFSLPATNGARLLAAPGTVIAATAPGLTGLAKAIVLKDTLKPFTGTSFAAPVVTATVALLKERYPTESAAQLRERLYQTAHPGTNAINPAAALSLLPSPVQPAAPTPPVVPQPAGHELRFFLLSWLLGLVVTLLLVLVQQRRSGQAGLKPRRRSKLHPVATN